MTDNVSFKAVGKKSGAVDDSNKYTLLYPVELPGGEVIKEVTVLERIKGKNLRQILNAPQDGDKAIVMIATLTGLPEEIVDEFDSDDIEALNKIAEKKGST